MTEAELQRLIIDAAELGGWMVYHVARSDMGRVTSSGFPDLVMLRPPELLFVELKAERGRVSPDQRLWLEQLSLVDFISSDVVRPADADGLIARLLRRPERVRDGHEVGQALDDFHGER